MKLLKVTKNGFLIFHTVVLANIRSRLWINWSTLELLVLIDLWNVGLENQKRENKYGVDRRTWRLFQVFITASQLLSFLWQPRWLWWRWTFTTKDWAIVKYQAWWRRFASDSSRRSSVWTSRLQRNEFRWFQIIFAFNISIKHVLYIIVHVVTGGWVVLALSDISDSLVKFRWRNREFRRLGIKIIVE